MDEYFIVELFFKNVFVNFPFDVYYGINNTKFKKNFFLNISGN